MQISSAFGQVQDSLSFIVTSYTEIAEYQSVVERLRGFHSKIEEIAADRRAAKPIAIDRSGSGLAVNALDLNLPDGRALRSDIELAAGPGNPVLVTRPSGSGKKTPLRAVARIWPVGPGHNP